MRHSQQFVCEQIPTIAERIFSVQLKFKIKREKKITVLVQFHQKIKYTQYLHRKVPTVAVTLLINRN